MKYDIGTFRTRARVMTFRDEGGEYGAWDETGALWCRLERARVSGYISMPGLAAEGWRVYMRARALSRHNCLLIGGRRHWILDVDPPQGGYMTALTVTVPTVTVTLYNVRIDTNRETYGDTIHNNITLIREALIAQEEVRDVRDERAQGTGVTTLYIPFGTAAVDGADGKSFKRYLPPAGYAALEDPSGAWTLETGPTCFFLRGEAVEPALSFRELQDKHGGVCAVAGVRVRDFYGLRHFEAEGR